MTARLVTGLAERAPAGHDPLQEENIEPVGRVQQLREASEAAKRENDELRRELARAHAENRRLRSLRSPSSRVLAGAGRVDRTDWVRVMLADSHSRNP